MLFEVEEDARFSAEVPKKPEEVEVEARLGRGFRWALCVAAGSGQWRRMKRAPAAVRKQEM